LRGPRPLTHIMRREATPAARAARADGTRAPAPLAAPPKVAAATVMSFWSGTVTDHPVAELMAFICVTRPAAVAPLATAVCTELAVATLVSMSSTNVMVAARRAVAVLAIWTPLVYVTLPVPAVHNDDLTALV
jgi:hypothetical protein